MKIVYVMGYGRSGSTLLDIMLGDNDNVITTGALSNYILWADQNLNCACGQSVRSCDFWGNVIKDINFSNNDISLLMTMDSINSFFIFKNKNYIDRYCQLTRTLFHSILYRSKKSTIIDSSKTARDSIFRPLMLSKYCNFDLRPIFLVRDPRGVVFSAMNKHGSPEREKKDLTFTRFLRTLISWNFTNFMTIIISKFFLRKFLFIKYEDLCANPINTLLRIKDFANIDVDNVINKINHGDSINIGHNLGGNRLRFSKKIDKIKLDNSWEVDMPILYRSIVKVVSYPLMKYFRY